MAVSASEIEAAAAALARGGIVAYPTETVYGLGVDAASETAVAGLLALKGRDAARGISLLVDDLAMAAPLIAGQLQDAAVRLARRFWPGPLTIVVAASSRVARDLVGPGGGVGLRCSSDPVARELVRAFGRPLTSTSANPSGREPARSVAEARSYFAQGVAVFVDGGERRGGEVSTVVEFSKGRATLRRAGAIRVEEIARVIDLDREGAAE